MNRNLLVVALATIACGHPDAELQHVVERANPVLSTVRQPVSVVTSPSASNSQVIDSCQQAVEQLGPLRHVDFGDTSSGILSVHEIVEVMESEHQIVCDPKSNDPNHLTSCATWCRKMFGDLVDAVERAKTKTAGKGVSLQSLR